MLLWQQYNDDSTLTISDFLEEPSTHKFYKGPFNHEALRERLIDASVTAIDATDALGSTLLMKAIENSDEPTGAWKLPMECMYDLNIEYSSPLIEAWSFGDFDRSTWKELLNDGLWDW